MIARAKVTQNGDDGFARSEFTGKAHGTGNIDPGGTAHAQTFFFQKVKDDWQHFFIRNLERVINLNPFEVGGNTPLTDTF